MSELLVSIDRHPHCPECGGDWMIHGFQDGQWVSQCMGDDCDWWGPTLTAKFPDQPSDQPRP